MPQADRIAVIVDDMFFAAKINAAASAAGRQVEAVKSREQLEQTLVENPPALIILDLVLPDEDGLVLCSVLKQMSE